MNPGNKLGLFLPLMLLMWTRGQTPTTETKEVCSGRDVVLSCSAPPDTDLNDVILEWTRSDLEKKDVFMFRDRKPYLYYQHHQFKGRIEVKDPSFKSGDLSIILKNTTLQDSGLYRCHLINLSNITEQSVLEPIKVINLKVLGPETLEVYSRTDVVLSCSAPPDTDLEEVILEWTRSDLKKKDVFMFRDRKPYLYYQHHQFKGRTELKDPSLQSGDLSIILRNTTLQDSGEYGCHFKSLSHVKKRSVYNIPPIKVINLKVLGPEPERIQARPGQDVVLKMAPVDFNVTSFMWKRPEDQEHFVFLHGMGHPDHQHPQYKDRVELENQNQTPDQITDLSVILRRVQPTDSGTYNGYIVQSQQLRKRNVHQSEPDKVIILEVTGGGCRFEAGFGFVASVFISLIFRFF
ncbi:uncharacterized protein LOC117390061 isoform X2 [Periophthalmus magnuspinnatus]|uniref:uncharacterized protein LOC117390061 isoform X2 n=1 Tax=Periophthalmus magnuspinnatus TaxID=409849 RepID=UPI002436ADFB|nr:uncharacterized protein LOC117390061 isoform X2 [Periophthalmus magnuspinnatus]